MSVSMEKVKCQCCCKDDEYQLFEQVAELASVYRKKGDNLIQMLHIAQGILGYLPIEVQKVIADTYRTPLSEVSGVVSFYSLFSTEPRGEHTIRVCLGTACYVRGAMNIVEQLEKLLDVSVGHTTTDRKFTLDVARCIGSCGLAPAMSIDDVVFKHVNPDKLETILSQYYQEEPEGNNE